MSAAPPVVVDLRAAQSVRHAERGIARYSLDLVRSLAERHASLVGALLVDPLLARPDGIDALGLPVVAETDVVGTAWSDRKVLHLLSPFDLDTPVHRLWPRAASQRGVRLAVTVYDLIPALLPDLYLQDAGSRRRYRARQELIRAADAVLAISPSAAQDTVRLLGVPPARIRVVGAAPAPTWVPPGDREQAGRGAVAAVAGLRGRFMIYTGGVEPRKNVARLIEAYSLLPDEVRSAWQLVVTCKLDALERNHFAVLAERAGVGDRVVLTGYVTDEILRLLYQGTDLVVFPSLYEGYGLPVAEGLACGAPAIASATSSLVDLVPREATFDPTDAVAVRDAIVAALTDVGYRRRLVEWARRPPPRWADVADRTAEVYEQLARLPARAPRRRRQAVAVVGSLPPTRTPTSLYTAALVEGIGSVADADVDVYPLGPPWASPATADERWPQLAHTVLRPGSLGAMDSALLGYDRVVVCIDGADGPFAPAGGPTGQGRTLIVHGNRPPDPASWAAADTVLCTDERRSEHSGDGASGTSVTVTPLEPWCPRPVTRSPEGVDPHLVGAFGVLAGPWVHRVVEAFSVLALRRPALHLVLSGSVTGTDRVAIERLGDRLGTASRITLLPSADRSLLRRVGVAVQPGGPLLPDLAGLLAYGVPTVVTGTVAPDLEASVLVVAGDATLAIAAAVGTLLDSASARSRLADAAHAFAASHGFGQVARQVLPGIDLATRGGGAGSGGAGSGGAGSGGAGSGGAGALRLNGAV